MTVFELMAKLGIDTKEYDEGLGKSEDKAESFSSKIKGVLSGIGSFAAQAGKVVAGAVTAASAAIGAITKQAVASYGEYEQLVGGVETLFKSGSNKLQEYAANAYKTAGISANEYMETATSFAASLISSLSKSPKMSEEAVAESISALEDQVTAVEDANAAIVENTKDAHEQQLESLRESQAAEIEAVEAAAEKRIDNINKVYLESIKLVDEEKYERLKAIDEQIAGLQSQSDAEKEALEKQKSAQKKAELEEKLRTAKTYSERRKAQQNLTNFIAEENRKENEKKRKAEIEGLKDQKEAIKQEADEKKAALKETRDQDIELIKEETSEKVKELEKGHAQELKLLQKSQSQQLSEIKKANAKKLEETKKYVKEQSEILQNGTGEEIEITDEFYEKAADLADVAIRDMSDNANKMGTAMQSIQNAYQGFAKQNYTMLDNLKLGYGGTKEEMKRLLADANEYNRKNGIMTNYQIENYSDIIEAIHTVQQELGITGTTSLEAGATIQGSAASVKAAWQNLLVGLADENQDFDKLLDNLLTGLVGDGTPSNLGLFGNMIPRIMTALKGIGKAIPKFVKVISQYLPNLVRELMPELINSALELVNGLVDTFPQLIEIIVSIAPMIFNKIGQMLPELFKKLIALLPKELQGIAGAVVTFGGKLFKQVQDFAAKLLPIIQTLIEKIAPIVQNLIEKLSPILEKVFDILDKILPVIADVAGVILDKLAPAFDTAISAVDYFLSVIDGVLKFLSGDFNGGITTWGTSFTNLFSSILSGVDSILGTHLADWYDGVKNFFINMGSSLYEMTHQDEIKMEEMHTKYATLNDEMRKEVIKQLKAGKTAEEALEEARKKYLDTSEKVWYYENYLKLGQSGLNLENIWQLEENLKKAYREPTTSNFNAASYYSSHYMPHLASGGLAYGQTMAVIGDNINSNVNPEVISPLSDLTAMMKKAFKEALIETAGGDSEKPIIMDGVEVAKIVLHNINDLSRQRGYSVLQGV